MRICRFGRLAADDRDLGVPAAHVAHAVLHGEHAGLRRDLELGFEIVGRLGGVRVLEQDQRQAALFDRSRCSGPAARPSGSRSAASRATGRRGRPAAPASTARLASSAATLVPSSVMPAMTGTRPSVDFTKLRITAACSSCGQEGAFAGVAEDDQALHAVEAAEPGAEPLDGGMVDVAVAGERVTGAGTRPLRFDINVVISSFSRFFGNAKSFSLKTEAKAMPPRPLIENLTRIPKF